MTHQHVIVMTGATGNTGTEVVKRLIDRQSGTRIIALVRPSSDVSVLEGLSVDLRRCDLEDASSYLQHVPRGASFLGISNIRHCDVMLPHLEAHGIDHAFCVTTTAVFSGYHSYSALYREIESRLRSANVPMTLLRPSMIYGNSRDRNMRKLVKVLDRLPIFPVFGPGTALMQPVYVGDLADGIVSAVESQAVGEFNLAGPSPLTYNQILSTVAESLGRNVNLVHINHTIAAHAVSLLEKIPGFPVRHEQVMRLLEDKAFDISSSVSEFNYRPRSFAEGIALQIAEYRGASS